MTKSSSSVEDPTLSTKEKKGEPPPPSKTSSKRALLLEAKASGADDSSAAEYAGMSRKEFDEEVATDPTLETEMLAARAGALLKHLKAIEGASQWQAHVYVLEKLWPVQFADDPAGPAEKSPSNDGLKTVMHGMRPEQLPRVPELLQHGINFDNAKNPPRRELQCHTTETSSTLQ